MGAAVVTLKYRARTTPAGYRRLEQALLDMGQLYNAIVAQRNAATSTHRHRYSRRQTGRDITELRQDEPYCGYARRLLTEVERQVYGAFGAYYDSRSEGAGKAQRSKPRTKDPHRNRTVTIAEPTTNHLEIRANERPQLHLWLKTEKPSRNGDRATVHIMGLPALRFRADERLPKGRQPRSIDITLNAGQLTVGLAYELEKDWPEPECESAGVDPGVAHTLTASDSEGRTRHHHRPDERECDRRTRRLRRKLQRQRDAALADGRARWTSRRNRRGQAKRRFRWNGTPSRSYLKTLRQLQAVERRRSGQRRDWSHRVSAELVKRYAAICWEDTKIRNMTRSAQGTVEEPGTNVAQKRGLNRSILAQGWGQLRGFVEYKASWAGREFVPVPAQNTSITCPQCGEVNAKSRRTQAVFRCVACSHADNADGNAAETIRRQGLMLLGRADGRLASSEDETPARAAGGSNGATTVKGAEGSKSSPQSGKRSNNQPGRARRTSGRTR